MPTCKLIIEDEVNIKLEGLDVAVRRKISNSLKFDVPYAKHMPQYKLGRWDGKVPFFGIGGTGYVNHLDTIIGVLTSNNVSIAEIEDRREKLDFSFETITEDYWVDRNVCWPKGHPAAGEPIKLRDYQVDAINLFLKNPQSIQQIATGAGKCRTYDSTLSVSIDNNDFALSCLNCDSMKNVTVQMGKLAESVERYKNVKLQDNCEVDIDDLKCSVATPSGSTVIKSIIKKENLEGLKLSLKNGSEVKCAKKHILRSNNKDIFAEQLLIGDVVETINGSTEVTSIEDINDTTFYDIAIDSPHLYYDADGVLHHNTITTATLSHITEEYGRSLIIVPNKSLVTQTEEDYINCDLDVGVYFGDRKELGKTHTICTWQSLNILDKRNKNGEEALSLAEFLDGVRTVMVDEAHVGKAEVLRNLLTKNLKHAPIRWGLTGTVPKEAFEFESLHASIGPVVGSITAKELQDKGVLSNCHVNIVQLMDVVEHSDYQSELKYLVSNQKRLDYISTMMNKIKETGNTLILVDRISAGEMLHENMPGSTFISGSVKVNDRKETYDTIREGTNEVIIATYGVAAVGLNIPRIFNLVLIEPGKSFVRVIQSIGRGVRKAEDKDFVQIWDVTSTCKYAKRHLTARKKFYKEAEYPFSIEKVDWEK